MPKDLLSLKKKFWRLIFQIYTKTTCTKVDIASVSNSKIILKALGPKIPIVSPLQPSSYKD